MLHRHYTDGGTGEGGAFSAGHFLVNEGGIWGLVNEGHNSSVGETGSSHTNTAYISVGNHTHSFAGWSNAEMYQWDLSGGGNYWTGYNGGTESRPNNYTYIIWKRIS